MTAVDINRQNKLTATRLRELLHYDPETGVFTCRVGRNGTARIGSVAGFLHSTYLVTYIGNIRYYVHRLAWLYMTGAWPTEHIDHINGSRTDNRWKNLREATPHTNSENQRRARKDNSSGFLGVYPKQGSFAAGIRVAGKNIYLGTFPTAEAAHAAYLEAKRKLHEGCTI